MGPVRHHSAVVHTVVHRGIEPISVAVEVDLSPGLPAFNVVGLPEGTVREARERVRSAIAHTGFEFPRKRITVNLAPADVKKEGTGLDLPIAVGILAASRIIDKGRFADLCVVGELSLNGDVRRVRGGLIYAEYARDRNLMLVISRDNAREIHLVEDVVYLPVASLGEVVAYLDGKLNAALQKGAGVECALQNEGYSVDFSDVKGQLFAKRALEVAVAGMHNVLMIGPPGSGKTMLARCVPTIMPVMSEEECLETTKIYSVAGLLRKNGDVVKFRPFRNPHHTISDAGLAGGGQVPRPGEISLAHNGVLFLDEMPEFKRNVLEILRQPLEEGRVVISRAGGNISYPARFMLVGAMNPCPCGYFGHEEKECICTYQQMRKYRTRVSGPLMDRIDIQIEVPPIDYAEWATEHGSAGERSEDIKARVERAVEIQRKRLGRGMFNSHMSERQSRKHCTLTEGAARILEAASRKYSFSARSISKVVKVARTIADLECTEKIDAPHVAEAVQYRLSAVEDEVSVR